MKEKYKTKKWRELRNYILIRDEFKCQFFARYGIYKRATLVHHLTPASDDPSRFFDASNLIALSNEAHERMHDRSSGKLSEEGERLRLRVERSFQKKRD